MRQHGCALTSSCQGRRPRACPLRVHLPLCLSALCVSLSLSVSLCTAHPCTQDPQGCCQRENSIPGATSQNSISIPDPSCALPLPQPKIPLKGLPEQQLLPPGTPVSLDGPVLCNSLPCLCPRPHAQTQMPLLPPLSTDSLRVRARRAETVKLSFKTNSRNEGPRTMGRSPVAVCLRCVGLSWHPGYW